MMARNALTGVQLEHIQLAICAMCVTRMSGQWPAPTHADRAARIFLTDRYPILDTPVASPGVNVQVYRMHSSLTIHDASADPGTSRGLTLSIVSSVWMATKVTMIITAAVFVRAERRLLASEGHTAYLQPNVWPSRTPRS